MALGTADDSRNRLGTATDLELLEDGAEIVLDCFWRKPEFDGNFLVGLAVRHQCKHPPLLTRKLFVQGTMLAGGSGSHRVQVPDDGLHDARTKHGQSACHRPDRLYQKIG